MNEVQEVFGGRLLKLDYLRESGTKLEDGEVTDLSDVDALDRCPASKRYARFIVEDGQGVASVKLVYLRCKLWSCPFCAKVNAVVLFNKIRRGVAGCLEDEKRKGFRAEYAIKFLTLTLPGNEWRSDHSRKDAESVIKYAFKKMISQLRRKRGHIEYFWVMEFQKDGYAHLHVILVGQAIGPKSVLTDIEKLWRVQQSMGFVRLNALKEGDDQAGIKGMCSYLSKYITKGLKSGFKGSHVYGASSGFHAAAGRDKPQITMIEMGRWSFEDGRYSFVPLWTIGDAVDSFFQAELTRLEDDESKEIYYQMPLPF